MKIPAAICLMCVFFFAAGVAAQEGARMNGTTDFRRMVRASSANERIAAKERIDDLRKQIIDQMIQVLNDPVDQREEWLTHTTSRNIALSILGDMRAAEAVPHIVKWLRPQGGQLGIEDHPDRFSPAAKALVKIGKPAVPALIALIETEGDEYPLKESLSTLLSEIDGKECAELVLRQALTKQSNAQSKQRIESALRKLR